MWWHLAFDPEARDGPDWGREPPAMYTSRFVQSGWPWRSHRRGGGRGRVCTRQFEGPRSWRKPRIERAGTRNDWGPSHCPLLELAGTNRTRGEVPKSPGNRGDSG